MKLSGESKEQTIVGIFARRAILWVIFLLLLVPLFFISRATFVDALSQMKDKYERRVTRVRYPNEPLEIVRIGNRARTFALTEKFKQQKDWLVDFSVEFKNDSEKSITFLSWQLDFPETQSTGNLMVFTSYYGIHPIRDPKEYKNEPPILAGEVLELTLTPKRFDALKAHINRRHPLDSLTHANIRILEIRYDDGTGWNSGSPTKEDPNYPGRFLPVELLKRGATQK